MTATAAPATAPPAGPLRRNRDFWLLAAGQGISRLGDGLYTAALTWSAWLLTHDPAAVGLVGLAVGLPAFLGTIVGASYADRYDRRRLMIGCDLLRALLVAPVPVLLALGWLDLFGLTLLAAAISLAGAPFGPARNAIVPQVVPKSALVAANGLLQVAFRASFQVGPLLLGPLAALFSMAGLFAVDAATFVVSAVTLWAMRPVPVAAASEAHAGLAADLRAGYTALRQAPDVLLALGTFVFGILAASGFRSVGLAVWVADRADGDGGAYGLLFGAAGLAEVAGALLATRWPVPGLASTAVLAWLAVGVFRAPLGFAPSLPVASGLLIATGLLSAATDIPLVALIQSRIPPRHLAKALGLWEAGITGAVALSPLIASLVIERAGVEGGFLVSGLAMSLVAALAWLGLWSSRRGS